MKEQFIKVNLWWSHLAKRERHAILLAVSSLFLFMTYQWLWSPLMESRATLRQAITNRMETYASMQAADQELTRLGRHSNTTSFNPTDFLELMQKQITQNELEKPLTQLKQTTNESILISFQRVEFDRLMSFLMIILKNKVSLSQLTIIADNDPGLVNADLNFKIT